MRKSTFFYLSVILVFFTIAKAGYPIASPKYRPLMRLDGPIHNLKISKQNRFIAYTNQMGMALKVADLKTRAIFLITKHKVGPSYFWSPDGFRLFYRILHRTKGEEIKSIVKIYDMVLHKSSKIKELPSASGLLTLDPRDLRFMVLFSKGILIRRLEFPDQRLAGWQKVARFFDNKWLASKKNILWVTDSGFTIRTSDDDGSGVASFDISPDGTAIVWATNGGAIYYSQSGNNPKRLGWGKDPNWHPKEKLIVYAAALKIGNKVLSYDLRVMDINGKGRYLTRTQGSSEMAPKWLKDGKKIAFTIGKTTDLYYMEVW